MKKRVLSLFIVLCIALSVFAAMPDVVHAEASGACGDNLTWTFDNDTLTISGTGDMWDYEYGSAPWWEYYSEYITNIIIQEGVTSIGNYAFSNSWNLENVEMADSVTNIGDYAFEDCGVYGYGLAEVKIPKNVSDISPNAFSRCENLEKINISEENLYYTSYEGILYDKQMSKLIICPAWREMVTVPDGVKYIGESSFASSLRITSVILPDSVIAIGDKAFSVCYQLCDVRLSENLVSIGDYAFYLCVYLDNINIPDTMTEIGEMAFNTCESIKEVTIPKNVKSIGTGAFSGCTSLERININENSYFCFENGILYNLNKTEIISCVGSMTGFLTISNKVTSIRDYAFESCIYLSEINLPINVREIGNYAFDNCKNLRSIVIPKDVIIIGNRAFLYCNNLSDVYYGGSKEDWNKIYIGDYNECLTNATIHYLGNGNNDDIERNPEYVPTTINDVTINGQGTAYGRFKILNNEGNVAKNKLVYFTIDGGIRQKVKTNEYGYAMISVKDITKSGAHNIVFWSDDVPEQAGVLNVTVEPLHFKSVYEATITGGLSAGLGIGVGGSIGDLKAEAKLAEVGLSGSNKQSLTFEQEHVNNKNSLKITAKKNLQAALNTKVGLYADITGGDIAGIEASIGDVSGEASYGQTLGVSFEDDDFNFNDSGDVENLARFLLSAMVDNMSSNVATRYIANKLNPSVDAYEKGSAASLNCGAKLGIVGVKAGGNSLADVTIAGINAETVWKNSTVTKSDGSILYKSSISAESGTKLLDAGFGDDISGGFSVFESDFVNNSVSVSAKRDATGALDEIKLTLEDLNDEKVFWNTKSDAEKISVQYKADEAEDVLASCEYLDEFASGEKGYFSLGQWKAVGKAMTASGNSGRFIFEREYKQGKDANVSASVQLFLKIGGKMGFSGVEGYEYEEKSGIYENNTAYLQAENDIDELVKDEVVTVGEIVSATAKQMNDTLADFWETVGGWIDDAVDNVVKSGQAVIEKSMDTVTGWCVNITKAVESIGLMEVLVVEDEAALFSTSSLATTIGEPYIISVQDKYGNEIDDFSENPLILSLEYTTEQIVASGVEILDDIAVLWWDEDKCVYVNVGGEVDEINSCVKLEIIKPGQYILAVDNCPPAITQFIARNDGNSPEIRAIVSDMSGIENFSFAIDESVVIDNDNFTQYYDYTTGEFVYMTEGLDDGEHIATIEAKDSFGNEISESIKFIINKAVPVIEDVSDVTNLTKGDTVTAKISGNDIASVFLNIETYDSLGEKVMLVSVLMEVSDDGYSCIVPDVMQGHVTKIWVNAYNYYGNSAQSELQEIVTPIGDSEKAIIKIVSVKDNTVKIICSGIENVTEGKAILAHYDSLGALTQVLTREISEIIVFEDADCSRGTLKVFLWDEVTPLSEADYVEVE